MKTARSGLHPIFETNTRVALVQSVTDKDQFAVAMLGGRYCVPLPKAYDGRTRVRWESGWIIVEHPDNLPPLLADTTTGKVSPMNETVRAMLERNYRPVQGPINPQLVIAR